MDFNDAIKNFESLDKKMLIGIILGMTYAYSLEKSYK